ncbi:FAD-dependent oxidoreductase [Arthrobacter mobilis]|uniref:FAD-dependent oxidoreductase n=1 Tax=Arthrobacter mobilis TaxID=2724944 RepID=UPI0035E44BEB
MPTRCCPRGPMPPLARGAYAEPGPAWQDTDLELLRRPVGGLYFAGEYAGDEFIGLMEGALRSGEHAALQLAARFNS